MKQKERADVDGSQLTGLACVILPAKVNVYRCREANGGQFSIIERTGQWDWLIVNLNGFRFQTEIFCNGCDSLSKSMTSEY